MKTLNVFRKTLEDGVNPRRRLPAVRVKVALDRRDIYSRIGRQRRVQDKAAPSLNCRPVGRVRDTLKRRERTRPGDLCRVSEWSVCVVAAGPRRMWRGAVLTTVKTPVISSGQSRILR